MILKKRLGKAGLRATMKAIVRISGWGRLISVGSSIVLLTMGVVAAQDTPGEGGNFAEEMKEWPEKISGRLRESCSDSRRIGATRIPISSSFFKVLFHRE